MFGSISIANRINIMVISTVIIGMLVVIVSSFANISNIEEDVYANKSEALDIYLTNKMSEKFSVGLTNAINLAENYYVLDGLKNDDRDSALIGLKQLSKSYKANTKFQNVKIHIHTADVKSFLRGWKPKKYGDDLSSFRHTINRVKNTNAPLKAIEVGRSGMNIRGIAPINYDGEYIGSVEFQQGFNSVIGDAKKDLKADVLTLMDSQQLSISTLLSEAPQSQYVVLSQKKAVTNMDFFNEIKNINLKEAGKTIKTKNYFVVKHSINDFEGKHIGSMLIANNLEIMEKVIDKAKESMYFLIGIMFLVNIILIVTLIYILKKSVNNPLDDLKENAANLASGDGDLTRKIAIKSKDRIGQVAMEFNNFIEKVQDTVSQAKTASNENSTVAEELSSTSRSVGQVAEQTSEIVSETNNMSQNMKDELETSLEEAKKSKVEIESANEKLDNAKKNILNMASKVQESSQNEIELAGRIQQLSTDAEQVKEVLTVISDIADQTNLLALNAAIEAARAGDHGRGFAVVADEVRKLAERTQKSLIEINSTINVIVQAISETSEKMNTNSKEMEKLNDIAVEVEVDINNTTVIMNNATEASEKTVQNYIDTGKNIDAIVEKIDLVNKNTISNTRSIEEIGSAAEHLDSLTTSLTATLNKFKT